MEEDLKVLVGGCAGAGFPFAWWEMGGHLETRPIARELPRGDRRRWWHLLKDPELRGDVKRVCSVPSAPRMGRAGVC